LHALGVIWKGDELIQGVPETLEMLRSKGKKLVFVTNNSWKSRSQYAQKFQSLGISVSQVHSSSPSFSLPFQLRCSLNLSCNLVLLRFAGRDILVVVCGCYVLESQGFPFTKQGS